MDKTNDAKIVRPPWQWLLAGTLLGCLLFLALRAALYNPPIVHHHANFGLFVNGERDKFDSFAFYEEVQSCTADDDNNPRHRVHMHNKESDVVHVHKPGVTWGHFFANLGYGVTNELIDTSSGIYIDDQNGQQLTFIINGEEVDDISNRIIESEDTLLISYGNPDDTKNQFSQIKKSAGGFNQKPDPASCSGSESLTLEDRLRHAFNLTK